MPPEWFGSNFNSELLTKVYWKYPSHIVRVCVSFKTPINLNIPVTKKSNLQVKFGPRAMASLYDLLCCHSFTSTDLFLEKLRSYLPTRFHSHIFNYIAYEHSSDDESAQSNDPPFLHFILTIQRTFFKHLYVFLFFMQLQNFHHNWRVQTYKRATSREQRTTRERVRRPYSTQKLTASESSSNCCRLSWTVQAGNIRSHC